MKSLIFVMFILSCLFISVNASAQPVIRDCEVQKCYKVLFPFPHSRCECVDYRYHHRYAPRRHYHPAPPRDHRPGHHPPQHKGPRR
jgi:hypothetical protein